MSVSVESSAAAGAAGSNSESLASNATTTRRSSSRRVMPTGGGAAAAAGGGAGEGHASKASELGGSRTHMLQAAAAEVDEGRATLQLWERALTVRSQRKATTVVAITMLLFPAAGAQLLHAFDAAHAHFALPFLIGGAGYALLGVVAVVSPVPPEVFGRFVELPGAASAAAKVKAGSRCVAAFTLLHNVAYLTTLGLFMTSDLSGRGGSDATNSQRWGVMASIIVALTPPIMTSVVELVCAGRCTCGLPPLTQPAMSEAALKVLLGATTKLVADVAAGLPVAKLERRLLQLREAMTLLWGAVAISLALVVVLCLMITTSFAVCVTEPNPPAFYVYSTVSLVGPLFIMPLTAVQVDLQVRRVEVALGVRACRAGSARSDVEVGAGPVRDGTAIEIDVEAQRGAAGGKFGFEATVVRALRQQQLDLLLTRMEKMRLGWYVLGAPVTSTLLARGRGVVVAVMVILVREHLLW